MRLILSATGSLKGLLPGGESSRVVVVVEDGLSVKEFLEIQGINPKSVAVVVNKKRRGPDFILSDNDEVFLVPPVMGG